MCGTLRTMRYFIPIPIYPGNNEDIEIAPSLICLKIEEELKKIHRYQPVYAILVYSLAALY
jgi:hypothetical protein